jgi:hypothetical protein
MLRIASLSGLLVAALALPVCAQKARTYKTPQECFDAGSAAFARGDHKTWVGCLAPASQKELAVELAVEYAATRASLADLKDREQAATIAKAYRPLFDVLDRHGLTAKATKDVKKGKDQKERQKVGKAVLALIKDPEAFLVDFYEAMEKLENLSKEKDNATEKLTDVKIDGDRATATLVRTVKGRDKEKDVVDKEPVEFVKVAGGWRMVRHFGPDAPKDK